MSSTHHGGYGATQYDHPVPGPQVRKPQGSAGSPRNVFIVAGVILLTLLCLVPVWNAVALLMDYNYIHWVGPTVPLWMIFLCLSIIVLYASTISIFFSHARPQVQTEQTIMMIANIFITLLGLVLMLVSLPLSRQSIETYNNLMHRCDYSEQTHRMYEYSQVLQNIRGQAGCKDKYSIEECQGYEEAKPYTTFLKVMENDFRCSGFCYRPPALALASADPTLTELNEGYLPNLTIPNTSAPGPNSTNTTAFLSRSWSKTAPRHADRVTPLALLATDTKTLEGTQKAFNVNNLKFTQPAAIAYPATLYSDANYQASCEGMAARDMKNFAGDIGFQTFYQGIYLVLIAIATGFLKLIGFCVRKDRDQTFIGEHKGGRM